MHGRDSTWGAFASRQARRQPCSGSDLVVFFSAARRSSRVSSSPGRSAPADYITDWQAWEGDFYTVKSTAVGWPPWEDYNTEGLRDREHALEKPPGSWRVACLGDSVTLGWGLRPQQAWPQVLEELAAASGRDLEVMNVALGGWSTRQELIAYRRIARRYRPDQVLLGICLNDVPEMQNNLSRPPRLVAELYRRSALVRGLVGAQRPEIGDVEELFTSPDAPKVRRAYELMFADLRSLRDEVRADGSRLAILVFPFRFQVAPGAPAATAQHMIADFCQREGIPLLDLLPAVAALGPAAFHDYDHFSAEGARLVAEQVLASRLLAEAAGPGAGAESATVPPPPGAAPGAPGRQRRLADPCRGARGPSRAAGVAAARGLATLGEAAAPAVPALAAALDDPERSVRAAAAWALGDVGPAAVPAVPRSAGFWTTTIPSCVPASPSRSGASDPARAPPCRRSSRGSTTRTSACAGGRRRPSAGSGWVANRWRRSGDWWRASAVPGAAWPPRPWDGWAPRPRARCRT